MTGGYMNMKMVLVLIAAVVFFGAAAEAGEIPDIMAFQSRIFDEGGNPVEDGPAEASFRIVDVDGNVIYEETQQVDIVRGLLSAIVGNGESPDGGRAGGIPFEMMSGSSPLYLDVEVGGYAPLGRMEIATVPFAGVAGTAYSVEPESIGSAEISDGSITMKDLSDSLIADLETGRIGNREILFKDELVSAYAFPEAASNIGVKRGLSYSSSSNLQGALEDIDLAVKARDERISREESVRTGEVSALGAALSSEVAARSAADSAFQFSLKEEISQRKKDVSKRLIKSGDSMSGTLNMDDNRITNLAAALSLDDAVSKRYADYRYINEDGGISVFKRKKFVTFSNQEDSGRDDHCWLDNGVWWCTAESSCQSDEILIGCSGYYNHVCWGDVLCEYMGVDLLSETCYAHAAQNIDSVQRLYAHAICMKIN